MIPRLFNFSKLFQEEVDNKFPRNILLFGSFKMSCLKINEFEFDQHLVVSQV